ncbi:MAG: serine dehydratase subunit alpha family protein, partial [Synergistaceae bacterium]|nr:serine dehydratase subunit alpha family protein [Synergistaceae bacterium]
LLSSNVFKNGATVGIPGTDGLKGNDVAAALALLSGKSEWGLEVLKESGPAAKNAEKLLAEGRVSIKVDRNVAGVYVRAEVSGGGHTATCIIEKSHANIVEVTRDGKVTVSSGAGAGGGCCSAAEIITSMTWDEVMKLADGIDSEDEAFLMQGVDMNLAIAEKGFEEGVGLGVGRSIREVSPEAYKADLGTRIKAWSAAASDARMGGIPMPVMSSAGSGNHGITAVIPVALYGRQEKMTDSQIAKGLLVSHLATAYVKSRTGRLSSTCGCAFAAGAGAAAGITWLMTEDMNKAKAAVSSIVSNLLGMLCDGAKESCAFKVGTGAIEAYHAAVLASKGVTMDAQGVVGDDIEETIINAAKVASSMGAIEQTVLDILDEREK